MSDIFLLNLTLEMLKFLFKMNLKGEKGEEENTTYKIRIGRRFEVSVHDNNP